MKQLNNALLVLILLVGAHVPRSFTLLYLFIALNCFIAITQHCLTLPRPSCRNPAFSLSLLLICFSLLYSTMMVRYHFWSLQGRDLLDFTSSLVLPGSLFLTGLSIVRRSPKLLARCLFSYSIGALIFLIACLIKTRGFDWFGPQLDPASLFVAWGSETSMNVRSIEQNGILAISFLPIAIISFSRSRYITSLLVSLFSILALLAVYPLANGRIWIISLILSTLPLFGSATLLLLKLSRSVQPLLKYCLLAITSLTVVGTVRPLVNIAICDERFFVFTEALHRWETLFAGGRKLAFTITQCTGIPISVSMHTYVPQSLTMLHSVPLDIIASVGIFVFIPLGLCLLVALYLTSRLFFELIHCLSASTNSYTSHLVLWGFISTLLPQWLFQPLIYSDGLLYYITFLCFGALFATMTSHFNPSSSSDPFKPVS